jgi:uncharacterized protein YgbK (DUF1537 family)
MISLGCIADDFTGGADVAAALRRAGMSVTLLFGKPDAATPPPRTVAVVVALKIRTAPAAEAVTESLAALAWLMSFDVERVYFKYCSTFDSTDVGNIGPVADALLEALGETSTLICPASPEHGRTMYMGHLFVGDRLLSESSMRDHPLTPMTDPDIVRVLERQTGSAVASLGLAVVSQGGGAVAVAVKELGAAGVRHVVTDAVSCKGLSSVAEGASDLRLLTGGAGLAGAVGALMADRGEASVSPGDLPQGPAVVLAGSCSAVTLGQVAAAAAVMPSYRLDPAETPDADELKSKAAAWLRANLGDGPALLYSSAGPEDRARARAAMGPDTAEILERTLGSLARTAVAIGARRIVVAGGETSGAVVQALDVRSVVIDHEADRGVPWCLTTDEAPLALLLKSGNFGSEDLFVRATGGAA